MPSNQTPNYALTQWERTDKVLMEDFNADNAKIDGALKAEADTRSAETAALSAALAQRGNCWIDAYTYKGTGEYGSEHPSSISFTHSGAALVIIMDYYGNQIVIHNEVPGSGGITITGWTAAGMTWYGRNATDQWNGGGETYHVFVFYALN